MMGVYRGAEKWPGLKCVKTYNRGAVCKEWVGKRVPRNGNVVAGLKNLHFSRR